MAKNFVQDGKTISLVNGGTDDILSGEPVAVGKVIAVAITDIAAGTVSRKACFCFPNWPLMQSLPGNRFT